MSPQPNENKVKKRLYLIDGYGFIFRAYHALPPMMSVDGVPVNAVYGVTKMFMKLISDARENALDVKSDTYMLVVFDTGKKTFRNKIYSEYKAHRPPAPDDLVPQFSIVREAVNALGLPSVEKDGYEADDIIAAYAKRAKNDGINVTIVSSDKDLMQLIDESVSMYDSMKGKRIGIDEVREKFGVPPQKVRDVLALMGDSSDNIPGVSGIGPKIASELVNRFGSLEDVLSNTSDITQKKRRESLEKFADKARLSYELVGLCCDIDLEKEIGEFTLAKEYPPALAEFLEKYGFKSLGEKVGVNKARKNTIAKKKYTTIADKETLDNWLLSIKQSGKIAIYPAMEKDGNFVGISLAKDIGNAAYIPIKQNIPQVQPNLFGDIEEQNHTESLSLNEILYSLDFYINDNATLKICHDLKASSRLLFGEKLISPADDIMVMSYVLDGSLHKHDLKWLINVHLTDALEDDCCSKVDSIFKIHSVLKHRLFSEKMLFVYENLERALIPSLFKSENNGMKVDREELQKFSRDFTIRISLLENDIYKIAGREFNIGSPKQLGEILFEDMGIPLVKKLKKSGSYATGVDILEELDSKGHDIANKVLSWRELSKLKSTYTDALIKQINESTGRIHTTFSMAVTSTGRLSSRDPNLQNIPIRTEEGRRIRTAFIAEDGNKLISADYSQIELRLLAHIADIKTLKNAFLNNVDIHALTASQVFGIPLDEITPQIRRRAKAINFGIIYGQSAFGLANQLGIFRKEAADYIEAYFKQYPGIRKYMDDKIAEARKFGFVKTLFGRKCYTVGINDKNGAKRQFAERAAINAPLQGTAADIIKIAMIKIDKILESDKSTVRIIMQVHDELVFEAPESESEKTSLLAKSEMEKIATLSIPLTVDVKTGDNWNYV